MVYTTSITNVGSITDSIVTVNINNIINIDDIIRKEIFYIARVFREIHYIHFQRYSAINSPTLSIASLSTVLCYQ
jgi:hypothetical protein